MRAAAAVLCLLVARCAATESLGRGSAASGSVGERPASDFDFFEEEARVITASRRLESRREAPANVRVITRRQLQDSGARTLADVLALLPGFYVPRHRKGGEQLWVRGTASAYNDKTLLLVDGFPFKELVYGQHPIDEQLPLADVKRVEVVTGPGSVLYGANAFTAVINLITLGPADLDGAEVAAGAGDKNTQSHDVLISRRTEAGGALVSAAYFKSAGDSHERDEKGAPSTKRDPDKLVAAGVKLERGGLSLAARYAEHQTEYLSLPDTKTETWYNTTSLLQLAWRRRLAAEAELTARAFYNRFDWPRERKELKTGTLTLSKLKSTREKTEMAGAGVQLDWSLPAGHFLVAGMDFQNERGLDIRRTQIDATAANPSETVVRFSDPARPDENDWGLFVEDAWRPAPWARLTLGLRRDQHDRFGGHTSPRAALVLSPGEDLTAKLLYGRAYRAPSFRELFVRELPQESDGDPQLMPEHIETAELDLAYGRESAGPRAAVALFRNVITDFITVDAATLRYANTGSYSVHGVEPELSWRWAAGHALALNYTLLRARDGYGSDAPNIAKEVFNASADARLSRALHLHGSWNRVGRRTRPANYQAAVAPALRVDRLGGYDRVNAALSTRGLPVELSLAVYNVFDERSFNPDYLDGGYDEEHPGRSFLVRARFRF